MLGLVDCFYNNYLLRGSQNYQSIIKTLPGFPGNLPFKLETGYIGVGQLDEVQLFYYFVESEGNPQEDPLLLWLTGGPGCSGFSALVYEIGPLSFNYAKSRVKPTLELNPYSWTKVASIIFLDAPVGTGFSYATTSQAYQSSDTNQGAANYEFLRKWLLDHPEFQSNRLYIAGDTYSGKIVPLVVQEIVNGNDAGRNPNMNLVGYVLGNPVTDEAKDTNSRFKYAYFTGLISEEVYETGKRNCKGNYTYAEPNNTACAVVLQVYEQCIEKINLMQILEPFCGYLSPKPSKLERAESALMEDPIDIHTSRSPWCRTYNYIPSYAWLNDKMVQKALHIREGTIENWVRCNTSLLYTKDLTSSFGLHRNLTEKGLKVLIYSGDQDISVPFLSTMAWIEALNLTIEYDWNPWFLDGQVAGYWMEYYRNMYMLTYATIKGGGHTAPEYKPKECFAMIDRWLGFFSSLVGFNLSNNFTLFK
ncbi:serine carboxypeptidase-like 18 isoform X1 [Jatropha curcas]|uniref:serine carboxypeptidase-like 18 isoform X1 n=1 Tax=Jatropha curcas TaxID=180498 RepID=UPI001894CA44|nr:serine carboxypeptidase-like 18 isoform X1 [Jatropha curcas]